MSDMIERLWRHDALRVQLQSRIGVVVASAVLLVAGQPATAQEFIDFEDPPYTGSAAGDIITGQDFFYIPVPDSQDGLVYTYAGNALGLPTNDRGGLQFAGVTGGDTALPVPFARAQRDVAYGDGTGAWTVTFDIAATFLGVGASAQNIGSFSTQLFDTESTFIALATWTDPADTTLWDARYVWYNASGTQLNEAVDDPAFQELDTEHWYRWSTTFNLDTNQIVEVSIEDLTTNIKVTHSPIGRFLVGGSAGGKAPPSGFRLFGGSNTAEGNTLAFDNVDIDTPIGTPSGACCFEDKSCAYLTEEDCIGQGGTYVGDFTACTDQGCIEIPKACGAKGTGPCGAANPGVPGCEDEQCCALVCFIFDPGCCSFEWDQFCADAAVKLGCGVLSCPVSSCSEGGTCTLSQSQNPFIDEGNQVACADIDTGNTTPNGWARCYNLVAEGVPEGQNLTIVSVTFGVAQATIDGIAVDVVIYLDCTGCPPGQPGLDALEIARVSLTVDTADVGSLITVTMPAGTVVPAGTDVIVEIENTEDGTVEPFFAFRTRSNAVGQCGPSYLRAAACGIVGWDDTADIGFPDSQLVQIVAATVGGNPGVECVPPPEACNKNAGACNEKNGSPGCNIESCCVQVCIIAPDCCEFDWDFFCVEIAAEIGECAVLELPEGFYINQAEFAAALLKAGKDEKGIEDFEENTLGENAVDGIDDPLDTNSVDAESFPDGILIDNLTFQANTGGIDSSVPAPAGVDGLALATTGFFDATSDTVVANTFVDAYDILSGPPAGDNHTAMSMTLVTLAPLNGLVRVDVYDKQENLLGSATNVPAPVDGGQFLGLIFAEGVTIGRVNIFDPDSGPGAGAEGVYDVTVYVLDKQIPCPWDLDNSGTVGATDLLSLLVNWGDYEPCPPFKPADFDQNCSVGATDLLALLVNWGPCP